MKLAVLSRFLYPGFVAPSDQRLYNKTPCIELLHSAKTFGTDTTNYFNLVQFVLSTTF